METLLNGTMSAAKNVVESAREGAEQAFGSARQGTEKAVSSTRSVLAEGIRTVGQIVGALRSLDRDDALGWVGLSRRRGPLGSIAFFGAGMVVGAGVGMLLAPVSGGEMRNAILRRFQGLKEDAQGSLNRAASEVKDVEAKVEAFVGKAAGAAKKVEIKVSSDAEQAKDAAVGAVKNAVDDGKPSRSHGPMHSPS
jgi:gas vesicle protein